MEVLDLDTFAPEARSVKFTDRAGKVRAFDATFMSFKTSMFMLAHLDEFRAMVAMKPEDVNEGTYRLILGVIEEIATQTDADLTVDFLFKNLSIAQGMKLVEAAMEPIVKFLASNPRQAAAATEDRPA